MIMLFGTKVSVSPFPVVAFRLNKRRVFHDFFIGKTKHLIAQMKLHFSKTKPS